MDEEACSQVEVRWCFGGPIVSFFGVEECDNLCLPCFDYYLPRIWRRRYSETSAELYRDYQSIYDSTALVNLGQFFRFLIRCVTIITLTFPREWILPAPYCRVPIYG
jgi:hypothetical protein